MTLRFQQKLVVPTSARPLIERPNVLAQLDRAIRSKRVVALAAPAGWGKTTALAQWVAQCTMPVAWYTLDSADRDPHVFLDYLLHSVADFVPGAPGIAARLAETTPQGLAEMTQQVALAFADAPEHFALILDDVHMLDEDQSQSIPGVSLVFALLALIAVFDYSVLQFHRNDTQRLAGITSGLILSDEAAERLTASVGWSISF
jgi:ATP/maltotriose-dependent transcriptional regulator MalT